MGEKDCRGWSVAVIGVIECRRRVAVTETRERWKWRKRGMMGRRSQGNDVEWGARQWVEASGHGGARQWVEGRGHGGARQ
ncbi:hypothetical protein AMTR_s00006p00166300 [Amborella trichopoda]|uniref:Uncharacterized protein n=1 Tax=Amborella trichopoda TaxID=13333 RepID=W1PF45_AMBTC|nr:hypothetical protein AMTR_s00006p00166300 [Amborella trichopoda]